MVVKRAMSWVMIVENNKCHVVKNRAASAGQWSFCEDAVESTYGNLGRSYNVSLGTA